MFDLMVFEESRKATPPPDPVAAVLGATPSTLVQYIETLSKRIPWNPGDVATKSPAALPANGYMPHHLMYAYMIENTRIVEVFRRVLFEYLHNDRLPIPQRTVTQQWFRTTEELFFAPQPAVSWRIESNLRPDSGAVRREAYDRTFGLALNHGSAAGAPYSFNKSGVANRDFVPTFERLLEGVWRGYINVSNSSEPRSTDEQAIKELVRQLREMLNRRRTDDDMSREEFEAVVTLSWFDLTIASDNDIMKDLNACGHSAAMRLRRIGDLVGLPIHSEADSYLSIAAPLSLLLRFIESGWIERGNNVQQLYLDAGFLTPSVQQVINHWSILAGRNIKATREAGPPMPNVI